MWVVSQLDFVSQLVVGRRQLADNIIMISYLRLWIVQLALVILADSFCHDFASRSASDNIRTIIEETESVYVQKFQRSINGTLFSGEFSKSLTSEREAVGAYFASGFIDQ